MSWNPGDWLKALGGIFQPVADVIDNIHTSDEERIQAHAALAAAQASIYAEVLGLEAQLVKSRQATLVAEIQGQSWLQRNWRPVTMISFVAIIVNNYILFPYLKAFGIDEAVLLEIPDGMWTLLQIGVGGYIVGRSGEKIVQNLSVSRAVNNAAKETDST